MVFVLVAVLGRNRDEMDIDGPLPPPQVAVFFDEASPRAQIVDSGGVLVNMDGTETLLPSPGGAWGLVNASQEWSTIGAHVRQPPGLRATPP